MQPALSSPIPNVLGGDAGQQGLGSGGMLGGAARGACQQLPWTPIPAEPLIPGTDSGTGLVPVSQTEVESQPPREGAFAGIFIPAGLWCVLWWGFCFGLVFFPNCFQAEVPPSWLVPPSADRSCS